MKFTLAACLAAINATAIEDTFDLLELDDDEDVGPSVTKYADLVDQEELEAFLQNMDTIKAGDQKKFDITRTNVKGQPGKKSLGLMTLTFKADGELSVDSLWGQYAIDAKKAAEEANKNDQKGPAPKADPAPQADPEAKADPAPIAEPEAKVDPVEGDPSVGIVQLMIEPTGSGKWSAKDPLEQPAGGKFVHWTPTTNIYWTEDTHHYSGTWEANGDIKGFYDNDGGSNGTFEAIVECDTACKTKRYAAAGLDAAGNAISAGGKKIAEGTDYLKKKIQGDNGVYWAVGSIAVVLGVGIGCYCWCKKDKGVMSTGSEGGERYVRVALI